MMFISLAHCLGVGCVVARSCCSYAHSTWRDVTSTYFVRAHIFLSQLLFGTAQMDVLGQGA
jgi:hypothetical protein